MGIFRTLGTIAGTAIGTAFGNPQLGSTVGRTLGGAVEGKGKKEGATTQQSSPTDTLSKLADLEASTKSKIPEQRGDTKVAKVYGMELLKEQKKEAGVLDDPWQSTRFWYEDLTGRDGNELNLDRDM